MSGILLIFSLVAFGALSGGFAGLLGVGGGIFIVPFLTLAIGLSQHSAEATSLLVILPTAIVASFFLFRQRIGNLRTAFVLGAAGAVGGFGGASLALALPGHSLRIVFALFAAAIGLRLVFDGMRLSPNRTSAGSH
jgi:uncharacterized membrane protein YfcA